MQEIKNLPNGLRVAIYGAGEAGLEVKKYIEANRVDLKIVCFFDKKVRGNIDGIDVYSIKEISKHSQLFDIVIVASYSNSFMMSVILNLSGIRDYICIDDSKRFDVFIQNQGQSQCICQDIDLAKLARVKEILNSDQSKEIFELVVKAYTCKNCQSTLASYLLDRFYKSPQRPEQYLDFINKEAIKNVISGGAFDAGSSLVFLDRLKNVQKICAFEPMYQKFKNDVNDNLVKQSGKIEIVEKGVFDKTTEISFAENSSGSRIFPGSVAPNTCLIKTQSIDEFVKEKNIDKVDFIKLDIEGFEMFGLTGAKETILNHRPQLAVCLYHSYNDLFDIPLYLNELLENYKFEVYHYVPGTIYETVLYAIPNELFKH